MQFNAKPSVMKNTPTEKKKKTNGENAFERNTKQYCL